MREALGLAARALGRTSPNPSVGCVVTHGHTIVGRGFHPRAGEPHAEVFALRDAGDHARGATAYVTLEPCAHFGRTPPCADALIQSGVKRVVIAALDPNPNVAGRGARKLRDAGIDVTVGVLHDEAAQQQAGFRSLVTRRRPWVVYKYAATLDGKVAATTGDSQWVSGPAARALVHRWRNELDAVAVGIGTVLSDNPRLTTRGVTNGRDARPVVFDSAARTPTGAHVAREGSVIVVHPGKAAPDATVRLRNRGVTVVEAEELQHALGELARLDIGTVLLEGGPRLASKLFALGLIDEVRAFIAPKLLGAGLSPLGAHHAERMTDARDLNAVTVTQVGADVLVSGFLNAIPTLSAEASLAALT